MMDLLSPPTGFLSRLTMVVVEEGTDEQTTLRAIAINSLNC
jgi:hypothetical protein